MADPQLTVAAHQIINTYQAHLRETSNANQAMRHVTEQLENSPLANRIGKEQAGHFAIDTVLEYRRQMRDYPHAQARERAAYLMTTPASETGLDVKNYTRSVLDSIKAEPDHRMSVMAAHSSIAAEQGRTTDDKAYALARQAYRRYESAIGVGLNHTEAREAVAEDIGKRYDNRGNQRPELDIKAYASSIIDAAAKGDQKAVDRYVTMAADKRGLDPQDAQAIATQTTIHYHRAVNSGMPPQEAKTIAANNAASRYDGYGKIRIHERGIER